MNLFIPHNEYQNNIWIILNNKYEIKVEKKTTEFFQVEGVADHKVILMTKL